MDRRFWDRSIFNKPPDLSLSEDDDGILIKVTLRGRIIVILSTLATVGCVLLAVDGFVPHRAILIVAALGAALGAVMSLREQKVTLRVTNLEFETLGYFGGSYRHRRSEPRMSIQGLEHRRSEAVPGLYANMPFYWACLLPYVTEPQANEIIERIYLRFPDTPAAADPFTKAVATLKLD